jgi:hypothetical protein
MVVLDGVLARRDQTVALNPGHADNNNEPIKSDPGSLESRNQLFACTL